MSDRFALSWSRVEVTLEQLITALRGDEHLFIKAFQEVSPGRTNIKTVDHKSVEQVKKQLRHAVLLPSIPWVLFDTISALVKLVPLATRRVLCASIGLETGFRGEKLRLTQDGLWQIAWHLDGEDGRDNHDLALDWYQPPDRDRAPLVPVPIIDNVSACVSLLHDRLLIPAATLLLVTFESALWKKIEAMGTSRTSERIRFEAAIWNFKRVSNKLVLEISGADRELSELDAVLGTSPAKGTLHARKMAHDGKLATLVLEGEVSAVEFVTSSKVHSKEIIIDRGLAEAVQRARSLDLLELPIELDLTAQRLRNALIHLPADGKINPPVPLTGGSDLKSTEELRRDSRFVKGLAVWLVGQINSLCV